MDENKIDVKELFGKYHKKLIAGAVVETLIYSLIAGFVASLLTVCVSRFARFDGAFLALLIGIAVFAFTAVFIYQKRLRPSVKRTAARVDRLGLEERAVTMLELDGEVSFMAVKQRENAKTMLKKINPRQLKIKIPAKYALMLVIAAAVSTYMMLLPPVPPISALEVEHDELVSIVEQMLQELRETIDEADVNEELKEELNELVDRLEASFTENDTAFDRIMKIIETSNEIRQRLENAQTQRRIGEALQQYDSTRELGESIENGSAEQVEEALENMRENVERMAGQEMAEELNQVADDIESALSDADNPEGALAEALQQLADDIREVAELAEEGENEAAGEALSEALEAAAESIAEALAEEANIVELMEELEEIMGEAIVIIAEEEIQAMSIPGENGEGENGQGENGEGENGQGENGQGENGQGENGEGENGQGENGEGENGQGENGQDARNNRRAANGGAQGGEDDADFEAALAERNASANVDRARRDSEPVIDGKTPYLNVFDEFFEEAKQQLINGELSDELREKTQKYFEIIK